VTEADNSAFNGTYMGPMTMTASQDGKTSTGKCTLKVEFDHTQPEHEIQGGFSCDTEGELGQMQAAFGDGKIAGGLVASENAGGELKLKGEFWYGPINDTWTGSSTSETDFEGSWKGSFEANPNIPQMPSFDYTGEFRIGLIR